VDRLINFIMTHFKIFNGLLVDCNPDWSLRIEPGILVLENDKIIQRGSISELGSVLEKYKLEKEDVIHLKNTQFLLPGLIDTHIHASQFPNAGGINDIIGFIMTYITIFRPCPGPHPAGLAGEVHLPH